MPWLFPYLQHIIDLLTDMTRKQTQQGYLEVQSTVA